MTVSPQELKEAVRAQTDIDALIGEAVALQPRRGGREYVGLCPFHEDRNPSLNVYPDRQSYRCWSCSAGGDCFTFLMEREKISFRDALEILARRANIPIPKQYASATPEQESNKSRLLEVLQWAENLFHRTLLTDPVAEKAREYLNSRGFNEDSMREYRLGYHPNDWEWLTRIANGKYSNQLFVQARLMGERDGGNGYYDNFVDRVLFPIHNERGQPVSFGGRILPGNPNPAKYWNGPESPVFHKSKLLYAFDKARDSIRDLKVAVVTEGYTACIACHWAGIPNAVATLGTALTDQQVTAIKRFAHKVVLVYDGDVPGQNAASRAVEHFLAQDIDLRILTLPDGLDPADYVTKFGGDALQNLVASAPEAWEFKFRRAVAEHGLQTIDGRQRVLEEMITLLAQVPKLAENVRESFLIANLAQRVGISEQQVRERLRAARSKGTRKLRLDQGTPQIREDIRKLLAGRLSRDEILECDLLEILFAAPKWIPLTARSLPSEAIRHPALRLVLDECYQMVADGEEISVSHLLGRIEDTELKRLLVWLDERSRNKKLDEKLRAGEADPIDGSPLLLRRSIDNLHWRQEEQAQRVIAVQLSQSSGEGSPQLDEATLAALNQASQFHQRRATKRTHV